MAVHLVGAGQSVSLALRAVEGYGAVLGGVPDQRLLGMRVASVILHVDRAALYLLLGVRNQVRRVAAHLQPPLVVAPDLVNNYIQQGKPKSSIRSGPDRHPLPDLALAVINRVDRDHLHTAFDCIREMSAAAAGNGIIAPKAAPQDNDIVAPLQVNAVQHGAAQVERGEVLGAERSGRADGVGGAEGLPEGQPRLLKAEAPEIDKAVGIGIARVLEFGAGGVERLLPGYLHPLGIIFQLARRISTF